MTDRYGNVWEENVDLEITDYDLDFSVLGFAISDEKSAVFKNNNADGRINKGETIFLNVALMNNMPFTVRDLKLSVDVDGAEVSPSSINLYDFLPRKVKPLSDDYEEEDDILYRFITSRRFEINVTEDLDVGDILTAELTASAYGRTQEFTLDLGGVESGPVASFYGYDVVNDGNRYSLDVALLNANQSPLEDVVVKAESDDVEFENDRIVFSSINEDEYVSLGGRFERKEFVEYNPQSRRAISFYLPDGAEKGSITIDLLVVDRLGNEMKYSVDIVI